MIEWIKNHKVTFALICLCILFLLIGIPLIINILFKIPAATTFLDAEWNASDALAYYGAILSFIGTVVLGALALYQNHIIKTDSDKKADLAEEQAHAENMPRFFLRHRSSYGFCGKLKVDLMNVSNNIAYDINIYDIKLERYSEIIWKSNDTYGSPVIAPQKHIEIQTNTPSQNSHNEIVFSATMSCRDKFNDMHEYSLRMVCQYPNYYEVTSVTEN